MATVNIYDMADTWNDAGTTFTAIKMDVTDTSSASGSLLMDLQVGSSSKFSVSKTSNVSFESGKINFASNGNITTYLLSGTSGAGGGFYLGGIGNTSTVGAAINYSETKLRDGAVLAWASGATINTTSDVILSRKGTANLRLGAADAAGPVAQTLSVQSVVAGTTNTAGQDFTIQGSAGTGSGAGGSIIFQVAPAGGSGTGQNTLVDALTINSSKSLILNNYNSNPYAGLAFPISGTYSVGLYQPADYTFRISMSNASAGGQISSAYQGFNFQIDSAILSWGLTSLDIVLARDAANILALRNGANAQTFNIYKTYTSPTVYERGFARHGTDGFEIGTEINTGSASSLAFLTSNVTRWTIGGAGGNLIPGTDNTYDIGVSGSKRPRTVYVADNVVTGATDFIHETSAALTDGAGANTATLTNAPSAGNPTKWIAINDNGTTRYIPTWE